MVDTRDLVFDRLTADFLMRGGARVSWRLFRLFADPEPHVFQLQFSDANTPSADNWSNCGPPQINASFTIDPVQRAYGKRNTGSYRVQLTTPVGAYVSRPILLSGILPRHDWLIAREVIRTNRLRLRVAAGVSGWIFRRRLSGATPDVQDPRIAVMNAVDKALVNSSSLTTVGTPYTGGYFAPTPSFVELTPTAHREMIGEIGPQDPAGIVIEGVVPAIPEVASLDVFAADGSDRRFYIHSVRNIAEWRGVPLLSRIELRVAPVNDPIYTLNIAEPYQDIVVPVAALAGSAQITRWRAFKS